MFLNNSDLV